MKNFRQTVASVRGTASVGFVSTVKPAAKFKGIALEKRTFGQFRVGFELSEVDPTYEGSDNSLPWGEWADYPRVISHKGSDYLRLYPSPEGCDTDYYVDGKQVSRDVFAQYLTVSNAAKLGKPAPCFNVKADNVIRFIPNN